jgi:hypothetical protein
MKVETTGTKQFKPFELVITIESKEELEAIINMCRYNLSIPELVGKSNRNFITLFLKETKDALTKRV